MDTETDEVPLDKGRTGYKLRFGWAAYTRPSKAGGWTDPDWKKFTHKDDFWLWVMSKCHKGQKLTIWCHNSNFDYPVLDGFASLTELGWQLKTAIIDGPPTIVKYKKDKMTLLMCDTLNLWRMSLKKLGKKVSLEKLEMPDKWGNTELDDEYCRRDIEIIIKALTSWIDLLKANDMGGFRPTIAGQAMQTFRHRYMKDRILIDNHPDALRIARACYHGGRCECHFIGKLNQPIYYLDVNSMYPYVMSYAEMPVKLKAVPHLCQVHHLPGLLRDYCICARVRLETDDAFAPVRMKGKLCFPIGRFDAWLTTPEIEYALKIGAITEVYECVCYEKCVPFREFALDLYSRKEAATREGNTVEAEQWKLLINSFYGKWGQNGKHYVQTGTCDVHRYEVIPDINAQSGKKTFVRYFGGIISQMSDDAESLESHPAVAAHITAHARMVLWTFIKKIPPIDYFYCDTDGLLVTEKGIDALREHLDDFQLGGLRHIKTYKDVRIYGCKDLVLDGKATLKGIRSEAQRINENTYRQIKWTSLRGLTSAQSLNMPFTVFINKTLSRTYTKGIVGSDGFVSPLHLPEDG